MVNGMEFSGAILRIVTKILLSVMFYSHCYETVSFQLAVNCNRKWRLFQKHRETNIDNTKVLPLQRLSYFIRKNALNIDTLFNFLYTLPYGQSQLQKYWCFFS
jgi:hypothetical protein